MIPIWLNRPTNLICFIIQFNNRYCLILLIRGLCWMQGTVGSRSKATSIESPIKIIPVFLIMSNYPLIHSTWKTNTLWSLQYIQYTIRNTGIILMELSIEVALFLEQTVPCIQQRPRINNIKQYRLLNCIIKHIKFVSLFYSYWYHRWRYDLCWLFLIKTLSS